MSERGIRLSEERGIVTLALAHGPNALDEVLVDRLLEVLGQLREGGAPPLLVTSDHPSLFSPGWDLKQLAAGDRPRLERFLERFERLVLELFSYPAPSVAAIGGHAVAGGCLLAIACDQRVMATGRPRLGLAEHNLGVPVPYGCVQMLRARLGRRAFDELVFRGDGCDADRAHELGLVQRAVAPADLLAAAGRVLSAFGGAEPAAWAATKRFAHGGVWRRMEAGDPDAARRFLDAWFSPPAQQRIAAVVTRLGR